MHLKHNRSVRVRVRGLCLLEVYSSRSLPSVTSYFLPLIPHTPQLVLTPTLTSHSAISHFSDPNIFFPGVRTSSNSSLTPSIRSMGLVGRLTYSGNSRTEGGVGGWVDWSAETSRSRSSGENAVKNNGHLVWRIRRRG